MKKVYISVYSSNPFNFLQPIKFQLLKWKYSYHFLQIQAIQIFELKKILNLAESIEMKKQLLIKFWSSIIISPLFFEKFSKIFIGKT
jgi:hypothetical protein